MVLTIATRPAGGAAVNVLNFADLTRGKGPSAGLLEVIFGSNCFSGSIGHKREQKAYWNLDQ